MNRRTFLASSVGLSLAALTAGCQRTSVGDLTLALLEGSVPVQLIQAFQRQFGDLGRVAVNPQDSLLKLYTLLQTWHRQAQAGAEAPLPAHWVTQADYWLASLIRQGLIQPILTDGLERWPQLPTVWPQLVTRDRQGFAEATGAVWGIPYRWTGLAILYKASQLRDRPLKSWQDLLQPAFAERLLLPDHPRLVLGLGLKAMEASVNHPDPAAVAGLTPFLTALHRQVRWYNSDHTLKALIVGDATAVVGWLDSLVPVLKRYRHLHVAIPQEGTLTSADLWVQPSSSQPSTPLATAWLNYGLQAEFATQMAIYNQGLSPCWWGAAADQVPEALQSQSDLFSTPDLLERSEFLYPLSPSAEANYRALWQQIRGNPLVD